MKKESDAVNRKVKTEIMKPVVQHELDIIKEVYEDGSVIYQHEGETGDGLFGCIDTYDENLYDVIRRPLNKMEALINLLGDDDFSEFGFIVESIIADVKQQYEELFDHLERELGTILVDTVRRGQCSYRSGRIAGIRIKPKKNVGEATS